MSRPSVYLCGSISGLTADEIAAYHLPAASSLGFSGIDVISPMRGKQELSGAGVIDGAYAERGPLFSTHGIFTRDKFDVLRCDALLANFSAARKVSIGSLFEIAWAQDHGKPVVIVMDDVGLHDHPFIRAASPFIHNNLVDAVACLVNILRKGL